jgi:tRNA A-37 threonylcarbamoyl transferase component Bud32
MSERVEKRSLHPRTGTSTGVMEENRVSSQRSLTPIDPTVRTDPESEARAPSAPLQPGTVIAGRYRIERMIGAGGMGAVYEATQVAIARKVALKVVRADFARDPAMVARFHREARAASAVRHANVVMVHDFGQDDDGTLFMVMELLEGESLLARMRRDGALPPKEAMRVATEVLSALEAAHDAGVVHRDLKPDNVLVTEPFAGSRGKLKVLDFGIARIVERGQVLDENSSDPGVTGVGQTLGTPRYMSPEAVARLPVGPTADLYALGAILFEMIAGRPVFDDREPVILMGHHLRTPPPKLREVVTPRLFVPEALETLIDRLLAKLPTERPPNAAAVRDALARIDWDPAHGIPPREIVFAPPPVDGTTAAKVPRKRAGKLRWMLRFVALVLLGCGIAALLYVHRMRLEEHRHDMPAAVAGAVAEVAATAQRALDRRSASAPAAVAPPTEPFEERVPMVRISISGPPEGASYRWDDQPIEGPAFAVPRDDRPHRLDVSADGYVARTVEIVPDGAHDFTMPLERARRRTRGR